MAVEMGLWRADAGKLTRLSHSVLGLESQLEGYINSETAMLGERLLLIGRQVPTAHGGFIDLLAVDADGTVHLIELKRDKTPRDVTAQTIDYGSWVATLGLSDLVAIFNAYRSDMAFEEVFGDAPPEELNTAWCSPSWPRPSTQPWSGWRTPRLRTRRVHGSSTRSRPRQRRTQPR